MQTTARPDQRSLRLLLFSNTRDSLTGADRDWVTLANALIPDGVRVVWVGAEGCQETLRPHLDPAARVIALNPGTPWFTYMLQENARQERSTWLWTKILLDHARRLPGPLLALERALAGSRPNIVVTNTATVTLGALYAVIHGRPHLWFVKESLDTTRSTSRALARCIERLSTAVVVPSRAVARAFKKRVAVVADGSDVSKIQASAAVGLPRNRLLSDLGLPLERPVVVQVGGLAWWKGQHVTVAAISYLARERQTDDFSMLFLGGGMDRPYHQELELQLERSVPAWRERVRFVEYAPNDFSFLAAADLVLHPSILPDPFPNAVREAMILGRPVIASRDGGIPEMIIDGQTGILVKPDDPVELATALMDLLRSPDQRQILGRNAQEYALSHFDIRVQKAQFLALFNSATAR